MGRARVLHFDVTPLSYTRPEHSLGARLERLAGHLVGS